MKVTIKIFFLLLAISLAIGGIMVYAKTKVDPPVTLKQKDQFQDDISLSRKALTEVKKISKEDSIFFSLIDRINIYQVEDKIKLDISDKCMSECTSSYCHLFMERCFSIFSTSIWSDSDHNRMLNRISELRALSHSDKTSVLTRSEIDSLNLITTIISDYRQARRISRSTSFTGVSNAQSIIAQAKKYSNNKYLRNCSELIKSLANVQSLIAVSHYNYVTSQIEKLSQFQYFSKNYYEGTLIPYVDAVTTDYENKATALYGNKRDVISLWKVARSYYDQAMSYYGAENNN